MPSSRGNKTERNSPAQISPDIGIALCVEADNSQLIRGYPRNVSVSGQQLLPTDTQLQIKQILMGGEKCTTKEDGETNRREVSGQLFFLR